MRPYFVWYHLHSPWHQYLRSLCLFFGVHCTSPLAEEEHNIKVSKPFLPFQPLLQPFQSYMFKMVALPMAAPPILPPTPESQAILLVRISQFSSQF